MRSISIIVPFYNGLDTIEELVNRSLATCVIEGVNCNVLIVDDSADIEKQEQLKQLFGKNHQVNVLTLSRNFGQHIATFIGILNADESDVLTMDEDLKFPPEEIPALLSKLKAGGLVYAYSDREGLSEQLKDFVLGVIKPIISNAYPAYTSSQRLLSYELVSKLKRMRPNYIQLEGMIIQSCRKYDYHRFAANRETNSRKGGYGPLSLYWMVIGLIGYYTLIPITLLNLGCLIANVWALLNTPYLGYALIPFSFMAILNMYGSCRIDSLRRKLMDEPFFNS